ncbi:mitochondrial 50S ribosomal protein L24, putative [Pediculus humanus corporis]|uniref:Large ribosomal subunit protein uL24m n=1 Tax=Pediculus humanus subsp. corporis TaxID=121224 RepID=E0VWA6_PEDHC|nr:mitochondrial 50S ribosomal protein L24, putative [Pediculus humanus corporis]EEB17662.1 mitochondrial 50S ribosomal protein L24, putative [Pediculus humanus corporis]
MRIPGLNAWRNAKVAELTKKHSNLPERYIKKTLEEIQYKPPKLPNYRQIYIKRIKNNFTIHEPWSMEFQTANIENAKFKKVWIEPIKEWSVFRGDRVEVLVGKDKGKQGIVCEIIQERNWVLVEGLNTYLKLVGKTKNFPGMLVKAEAPLLVTSEIALVDPNDLKPTKILWRYDEKGEKVRVSERTGRIIPMPLLEEETYDYKTKQTYQEKKKDTTAKEVTKITFVPTLQTFEMSLMEEYNIEENRIPKKVYWY